MLRVFFLGTVGPEGAKAYLEREATVHQNLQQLLETIERDTDWDANALQPLRLPSHRKRTPIRRGASPMGAVGRHPSRRPRPAGSPLTITPRPLSSGGGKRDHRLARAGQ